MAHLSENTLKLQYNLNSTLTSGDITPDVTLLILPYFNSLEEVSDKVTLYEELNLFINQTNPRSVIAILTSPVVAADFCTSATNKLHLKLWMQ
ncbi:MAG: hypothetical protein IPN94_03340 [Sphingobacteriales bacterium]|nr:hypothetical protein [Sphingobacteriales bacterium]